MRRDMDADAAAAADAAELLLLLLPVLPLPPLATPPRKADKSPRHPPSPLPLLEPTPPLFAPPRISPSITPAPAPAAAEAVQTIMAAPPRWLPRCRTKGTRLLLLSPPELIMLATGGTRPEAEEEAEEGLAPASARVRGRGRRKPWGAIIHGATPPWPWGPPGGATKGLCVVVRNLSPSTAAVGRERRSPIVMGSARRAMRRRWLLPPLQLGGRAIPQSKGLWLLLLLLPAPCYCYYCCSWCYCRPLRAPMRQHRARRRLRSRGDLGQARSWLGPV